MILRAQAAMKILIAVFLVFVNKFACIFSFLVFGI